MTIGGVVALVVLLTLIGISFIVAVVVARELWNRITGRIR